MFSGIPNRNLIEGRRDLLSWANGRVYFTNNESQDRLILCQYSLRVWVQPLGHFWCPPPRTSKEWNHLTRTSCVYPSCSSLCFVVGDVGSHDSIGRGTVPELPLEIADETPLGSWSARVSAGILPTDWIQSNLTSLQQNNLRQLTYGGLLLHSGWHSESQYLQCFGAFRR